MKLATNAQPKNTRNISREEYPLGKESTLFNHIELGSASVESLISFNERANDSIRHAMNSPQKEEVSASPQTDFSLGKDLFATDNVQHVLHPAFVQLGMDYATGQIIGSYRRCHAFLEAFIEFLSDYRSPKISSTDSSPTTTNNNVAVSFNTTALSSRLISYLNSVVNYLDDCRQKPLAFENLISRCQDIIEHTCRLFDSERECIHEMKIRIEDLIGEYEFQQSETVSNAQKHLKDGDVVLTFGHSEVVVNTLLEAQRNGLVLKVIVIDSNPLLEGKKTLHTLTLSRFECEYALITSLQYIMPQVSKVLLGAHAVLSTGAMLSRSGSALVALSAKRANKPVLVCCEAFKFVRQAYLDSICYNELGPPANILLSAQQQRQSQQSIFSSSILHASDTTINEGIEPVNNTRLAGFLHQISAGAQNEKALAGWLSLPQLKLLNLRYDLTPSTNISALVTNYDTIPPSSASVVVRESSKKGRNTSTNNNSMIIRK